jgi:hypothetical protein
MTRPFVALPPAKAVIHAAPSTLADIARVLVVVGPVAPLPLPPPHAVDTNRIDIAIAKRRCIDRSVFRETRVRHLPTLRRVAPKGVTFTRSRLQSKNFSGQSRAEY